MADEDNRQFNLVAARPDAAPGVLASDRFDQKYLAIIGRMPADQATEFTTTLNRAIREVGRGMTTIDEANTGLNGLLNIYRNKH